MTSVRNNLITFEELRKKAEKVVAKKPPITATKIKDAYKILHELSIYQIELELQNEQLRQSQAEVDMSRNEYFELYDTAPVSYFTLDKTSIILKANFNGADLLNINTNKLIGKNFTQFVHASYQNVFQECIQKIQTVKARQIFELELITADSNSIYVQAQGVLNNEKVIQLAVIDITVRKQAEVKLLDANNSMHLINNLYQSSYNATAALDHSLKFITFNKAFADHFYKVFSVTVDSDMNFINILLDTPKLQSKILTACKQALSGEHSSLIVEADCKINDINYYRYEFNFNLIYNEKKQSLGLCFTMYPLAKHTPTEEIQPQRRAKLDHATQLNLLNKITVTLAREISQPLTAINAYSKGCMLKLEKNILEINQILEALQCVATQAEQAGTIIHQLKNFIAHDEINFNPIDINQFIIEIFDLYKPQITEIKAIIHFELSDNLPNVLIDRAQIEQAIANLLLNSIKTMRYANTVQPKIGIRSFLNSNNAVEIHLIDNGPNISNKLSINSDKKLTEYLQSNCLNLSICQALIATHGGTLTYQPNPTGGTWFSFALPTTST